MRERKTFSHDFLYRHGLHGITRFLINQSLKIVKSVSSVPEYIIKLSYFDENNGDLINFVARYDIINYLKI